MTRTPGSSPVMGRNPLEAFSHAATRATGSSAAFALAVAVVVAWAATGRMRASTKQGRKRVQAV